MDAISHSKFWQSTALFIIEDDAQNGPDHVDSHRAPAFVVSPYTRRARPWIHMYNQASVLRTMERITRTAAHDPVRCRGAPYVC